MTRGNAAAEDCLFTALAVAAPDLTETICQTCERRIEVYRLWRDAGEGDRLRETIRVILDHFAASRGSTQLAHDLEDIGSLRATQGLPLEAIPTAWLIISDQVWQWFVAQSEHKPDVDLPALWTRFQRYVNHSAGAIQASYVRTRSEAFAAEVTVARATLDRLLRATSAEETEQALLRIGHQATTLRLLLCQHRDPAADVLTDGEADFKRVLAWLARATGRRIVPWTVWHGIPFLVLPPEITPQQVAGDLTRTSTDLRAVISRPLSTRSLIRPHLTRTIPLLDLTRDRQPVVDAEELSMVQITAAKSAVVAEEIPAWLQAFFDGDVQHDQKWTETAEALIAANLNVVDAAQALYLHHNTVYYRLESIRKHCGVDLREPAALADLQLAMQLRVTGDRWRLTLADPLDR